MVPQWVAAMLRALAPAVAVAPALAFAGAFAAPPPSFYGGTFEKTPSVQAMSALGRAAFFEPALSASGRLACAGCHDPQHAFGPPDGRAVRRGGRDGRRPGVRAVPSLTYGAGVPRFTEHGEGDGDEDADAGPAGGLGWDGRFTSAHAQAREPLLSAFEMANGDEADLAQRLRRSPLGAPLRGAFGESLFDDAARAVRALLLCLEVFQQEPRPFSPYSSKYDAWLRQQVPLSAAERRGLAVFNDPARGNCARCHPSAMRHGAFPQFTDFGYAALGVPRNRRLTVNADRAYFDLGLCGPWRTDLAGHAAYCGLFRTPSLRNVAVRKVFFHNGVFHDLRQVLAFYAGRDSRPEAWYPRAADGRPAIFDDLPARFRGNVDRSAPFGRSAGAGPAFSPAEAADLLAFLETLTDGYGDSKSGDAAQFGQTLGAREGNEFADVGRLAAGQGRGGVQFAAQSHAADRPRDHIAALDVGADRP
jgi:cytochrome c peroxidase